MEMDSAVANRYLQGEENLAIAVARGRIKVSCKTRAALHFLPMSRDLIGAYSGLVERDYPPPGAALKGLLAGAGRSPQNRLVERSEAALTSPWAAVMLSRTTEATGRSGSAAELPATGARGAARKVPERVPKADEAGR